MPPQTNPTPSISPTLPPPPPPASPFKDKAARRGLMRSILSTLAILIAAPIIALAITNFVFQSYEVDGPSMLTTLHNGDRLIVLKLPHTTARLRNREYLPKRGDVIVFNKNDFLGNSRTDSKQLIKRVIGLPGEHVVVKDDKVTIYNKANPKGFDPDKTMAYGKVITEVPGYADVTVPENEIFVMGDNRSNSLDSRAFGPIQLSDIVGRAAVRILPFDQVRKL